MDNNSDLDMLLEQANSYMAQLLDTNHKSLQEIFEYILESKGRQLRPKMLILAAKFGKTLKNISEFAGIVELIHLASLIHDDVIDDAPFRRGKPSVQKKFGIKEAIYAGDYIIFAIASAKGIDYDEEYRELISEKSHQLLNGELGQNDNLYNLDVSVDDYMRNIRGKTATLFELAAELGGIVSKAEIEIQTALKCFGHHYGMLFQIHDDLLDYSSDEKKIGKPIYQDFLNGIYTLPIIYALEIPENRTIISELADTVKTKNKIDKNDIAKLKECINKNQGLERTLKVIEEHYQQALAACNVLPEQDEKTIMLKMLNKLYESCVEHSK